MKKPLFLRLGLSFAASLPGQAQKAPPPYKTRFAIDAPVTAGLGALRITGLLLVQQKEGLTDAQLAALTQNDISKFNRCSAGYYSGEAQKAGDLIVYPSLGLRRRC